MFTDLSQWINKRTIQPCQRQLLLITGPAEWNQAQAEQICQQLGLTDSLWVGEYPHKQSCNNKRYQQQLGSEWDAVIYDMRHGVRANAMAALSGTLRQRGLMILLAPELQEWLGFKDPQFKQRSSFGFDGNRSEFLNWLAQQIQADDSVCHLCQHSFSGPLSPLTPAKETVDAPYKTNEQQVAVAAIVKVATGKRKRPLVLTADRGRGKSSSLGLAVAELFQHGECKVIITAPGFNTTEQVFKHAGAQLTGSEQRQQKLHWQDSCLSFYPFDLLLEQQPNADLLLIDEAAAIPTQVLEQLVRRYKRIVFSSTIHGYEGSGRGFELRFKQYLNLHMPDWKALHLNQAIRFADGDPLEQFWFNALLLKSDTPNATPPSNSVVFNQYTGRQLQQQPNILRQCFSLLVNAHYQTSPDDLSRLLDGTENILFTLEHQEQVLAVCWLCSEGAPYLDKLAEDIYRGKRRVAGHLIPQNLTYYYCQPELLKLRIARIVRIATLASMQRTGLASSLLSHIQEYYQQQKLDLLGSSFAASAPLLNFWHKNHYQCVRLGHKKDASSGEHSAIMLLPLSASAKQEYKLLEGKFQRDWSDRLTSTYNQIDHELIWGICQRQVPAPALDEYQSNICQQFANGQRPLSFSQPQLKQLLLHTLATLDAGPQQQALLVKALLQQQTTEQLTKLPALKGQKDIELTLRKSCQQMLNSSTG